MHEFSLFLVNFAFNEEWEGGIKFCEKKRKITKNLKAQFFLVITYINCTYKDEKFLIFQNKFHFCFTKTFLLKLSTTQWTPSFRMMKFYTIVVG